MPGNGGFPARAIGFYARGCLEKSARFSPKPRYSRICMPKLHAKPAMPEPPCGLALHGLGKVWGIV